MNRKNLLNFAAFQLVWFGAVQGAAVGNLWLGPALALAFVGLHGWLLPRGSRRAVEFVYILAVGLLGSLVDSLLHHLGDVHNDVTVP